jgi:hypothetical protein
MALMTCPDCGTQVSTSATQCPSCGRPIAPARIVPPAAPVVVVQQPHRNAGGGFFRALQIRLLLLILGLAGGFVASWLFGPAHNASFGDYCQVVTKPEFWKDYVPVTESNTPSGGAGPVSVNQSDPRTSLILWGLGGAVGTVVVGSLLISVLRPKT